MNILFLDIDGVLNPCDGSGLNTDKVALLKEISDATDCRIVLSSTWRLDERQTERVEAMCRSRSMQYISKTPDLTTKEGNLILGVERWVEIEKWLITMKGWRFKDRLFGFYNFGDWRVVILDDESDMGLLSHLHVRTDSHTGLTPELAREIISRFNDNPTTPTP